MGIKHFIVKVKGVKFKEKGLRNIIKYLQDDKRHPNGIINIKQFDGEEFFLNVCNTIDKNEKMKLFNGKGGRKVESYADSYVFSFPPSLKEKLNKDKLNKLTTKLINKLFNLFNSILESEGKEKIDKKTFLKYSFFNVHTDEHTHINVIFSRIFEVGENHFLTNRITNRKKFIELAKYVFDEIIEEEFQLKKELYMQETNIHKGYKNIYFKKVIEKVNDEKNEIKNIKEKVNNDLKEFQELKVILNKKRNEIKNETIKLLEQNEKREKIATAFQLIIRYYKSFRKQLTNKQTIKIITEYKKLTNKIDEFNEINENEKLKKLVNEIKIDTNNIKNKYKLKI